MRHITHKETITTGTIATTSTSTPVDVGRATSVAVQAVIDVGICTAKSFAADTDVNTGTDTITEAAHGYPTGLKIQLTSTGTLPAGVTTATDYYIIALTSGTYQFAASLANAQAGTAIDLTNVGTAASTHTTTPVALAGAAISLEMSNNYVPATNTGDFDPVATATAITADGNLWIMDIDPEYAFVRVKHTLTAGSVSSVATLVVKSDN